LGLSLVFAFFCFCSRERGAETDAQPYSDRDLDVIGSFHPALGDLLRQIFTEYETRSRFILVTEYLNRIYSTFQDCICPKCFER
jgi:hypothetical protein